METPKLNRIIRLDAVPDGESYFTDQGFFIDTPVVTRTGIFEYKNPDGSIRRELRRPEDVFDKESLGSYAAKPVIITHDAGQIDKDNVMEEIVGTILEAGIKDGDKVRAKIVIHDIDKVKEQPFRELSLGYTLELDETPGEWEGKPYDAIQKNIRINHLAIVMSARAGETAHLNLDGEEDEIEKSGGKTMKNGVVSLTPDQLTEAINQYVERLDSDEEKTNEEPTTEEMEVDKKDGDDTETTTVEEEKENSDAKEEKEEATNLDEEKEKLQALCDSLMAENKKLKEDACKKDTKEDEKKMNADSADIDMAVRKRVNLIEAGKKLNLDGLMDVSFREGQEKVIEAATGMRMDGKSDIYVDAAYDLALAKLADGVSVEEQKAEMTNNRADAAEVHKSGAELARERMIKRTEGGNE